MSRYVHVVDTDGEPSTLVRGQIREFLKARKVPAYWVARSRGWYIRNERMADLVAQLEHAGYVVKRGRS